MLSSRRPFSLSRRPELISARSGVADRGEAVAIAHRGRLDQRSLASAWFPLLGARSGAPAISQRAVQVCVLEPLCARDAPKQPRPKQQQTSVPAGQPRVVGLAGLEPAASSLSAVEG